MSDRMIRYLTPAVTPLNKKGGIDLASCEKLYAHLIRNQVDGILIFGSIGEFFAFTPEQKKELIRLAVRVVDKKVPLIVGTASMNSDEVVMLSRFALEEGADAVMIVSPFYFPFTQDSLFEYYDALAKAIPGSIYLYNFPDRTGDDLSPALVKKLALAHENIIGIKDTVGGMDHTRELIKTVKPVRPDFQIYSGFDDNFLHNILSGGNGCVAGLSNLYPEITHALTVAAKAGDFEKASALQQTVDGLMSVYSVGAPFVPFLKEALVQKGIIDCGKCTFPMPEVTDEQKAQITALLAKVVF